MMHCMIGCRITLRRPRRSALNQINICGESERRAPVTFWVACSDRLGNRSVSFWRGELLFCPVSLYCAPLIVDEGRGVRSCNYAFLIHGSDASVTDFPEA